MTKKITKTIILLVALFIVQGAFGQQRFLNNQRLWNDMMFNPAKILETQGLAIYANHRQQYYNMGSQSPYLFIVGGKANLPTHYSQNMLYSDDKKKSIYNYAIGGYYIHSYTGGVYDQNEICGQFGVQLKLNQKLVNPTNFDQLNFGISVKGINNRYRGNSIFNLYDLNDPQFTGVQVTNKFAFSVMPGIQYINKSIALDAVYTFGPTDQQFGSITIMGSQNLDNYFNRLAFRVNYFGNPNCQIAVNKIQELSWGINKSWAINYGVNLFIGAKFVSSSSVFTNPGIYLGLIYKTIGRDRKTSKIFKSPLRYNSFTGCLNIFDGNLSTIALGPSAELGLMYQRNTKICECDRMYDQFYIFSNKKGNLAELKAIENVFSKTCNTDIYAKSYFEYDKLMNILIKEAEEELMVNTMVDYKTCSIGDQEWYCQNLDSYSNFGVSLITSEAEWKKQSPQKACCCYLEFKDSNKKYGLYYNAAALKLISNSQELKDFRVANKNDWDKIFKYSKKSGTINKLYNCDGNTNSSFNLFPTGYYDVEWLTPEMDQIMAYWIGEQSVYFINCNSKEDLMPDEDFNEVEDRLKYSAFLIRIIKK
jgi:uncharacterized protein (TIGR02145 family)